MADNNLLISISILTFNRCALLKKLLEELQALSYSPLETIVIDNHSEDDTKEMIERDFPEIKYIRLPENIGAAGRNVGMKTAQGDIIVTLDDDVNGLKNEGIENLVKKFIKDPTLGAVNFRVIDIEERTCNWVHHCKEEDHYDKEFLTYEITEGAVAFRKKALDLAGYYPENFFLSHEGPDLAFRIFEKNFKVIYSGDIIVKHLFAKEGRKPWRNYYYDTRNQFWLAARNFPLGYSLIYLGRGLSSMLAYSIRGRYFFYWLKAVIDGFAGIKQALRERHVLSSATMNILKEIDSKRPSLGYMIRKRLLAEKNLLIVNSKNLKDGQIN